MKLAWVLSLSLAACSSAGRTTDGGGQDGGAMGLPPGSGCGHYDDGGAVVRGGDYHTCIPNPALPQCWACLDVPDDLGAPAVCVFGCRLGGTDCPAGQTCVDPMGQRGSNGCSGYGAAGYCR